MVHILTSKEQQADVAAMIAGELRLAELVSVSSDSTDNPNSLTLLLDAEGLKVGVDWTNQTPPWLLPRPLPFSSKTLLATVYGLLGNFEKTWQYLATEPALLAEWEIWSALAQNYPVNGVYHTPAVVEDPAFEAYRQLHNAAIIRQYGATDGIDSGENVRHYFQKALAAAPNDEHAAFTAKQYATFLLDVGRLEEAQQVLRHGLEKAISEEAHMALKTGLVGVWMQQLTVPYDADLLAKLKDTLWETLQFYEARGQHAEAGLLLIDASFVANVSDSFAESLGYITKAIRYFDEEELTELLGNAQLRKGTLLYTWSHNGNPQFYRPALEAYQEALKIFKKDVAPDVFADIHHNLAVLYSEMPDENKKRSIWAAMSSSSFKEALAYYTKETHPYEYAMICNNFGNAMTRFPAMPHSDNYRFALEYYSEALQIRQADTLPYERALTLLNYLEASWYVGEATEEFDWQRYEDMVQKAQEIKQLVQDEHLCNEADKQLVKLEKLREVATQPVT